MTKELRLFIIRTKRSGKPILDGVGEMLTFSSKRAAKAARQDGQAISKGPDHRKYRGI